MQIKDEQLESFADFCRSQIRSWIATQECTKWQGNYKNRVVSEVLLATKQRREILEDAAQQLMETNPDIIDKIRKTINKDLKRSRNEEFLKEHAYKWLQYLQRNPFVTKAYEWYPRDAVKVAHRAFRMRGKLQTFVTYLGNHHRSRRLGSIPLPCIGMY